MELESTVYIRTRKTTEDAYISYEIDQPLVSPIEPSDSHHHHRRRRRPVIATVEFDIQSVVRSETFRNRRWLVSVSLPAGLKVIGERAFENCTCLKTIPIPSSVHTIRKAAFRRCKGLDSVDLRPLAGLTEIAAESFKGCTSLRYVHIPSTAFVLEIGSEAFFRCFSLLRVDLPEGLLYIGSSAFYGCSSLERILVPSTVVVIGSMAFSYCCDLRSVEISISSSSVIVDNSTNGKNHDGGMLSIGCAAFFDSSVSNIAIPSNCRVNAATFEGCDDLERLFPDDLGTELPERLKARFDNLPYHKLCYQQGHAAAAGDDEVPNELFATLLHDHERSSARIYDPFGLTPLHILALSARPSVAALQMLLGGTFATGILDFGRHDNNKSTCSNNKPNKSTPLRYAIENHAPGALAFIKAMLHALIDEQTQGLGLEVWTSDIFRAIETFEGRNRFEREGRVHDLFALLRLNQRKEVTSLLEQAVWKHRMLLTEGYENDRQGSYLNSGAGAVIQNVLPYLGSLDKVLKF